MIILLLDGVPCHMTDTAENYTNLDNSMLIVISGGFIHFHKGNVILIVTL